MGHVFISYSHHDKEYAAALTEDLRQHGFDVWIDARIESGDRWWKAVTEALEASSAVVVLMSPKSDDSTWVERELLIAENDQKAVFPLLLKGEPLHLLVHLQYIDVRDGSLPGDDFYERLKEVVPPGEGIGKIVSRLASEHLPRARRRVRKAPSWLAWIVPLVTIVVAALIGFVFGDIWSGNDDDPAPTPTDKVSPPFVTVGGSSNSAPTNLARYDMLFTSTRDGNIEIYSMRGDGSNITRLTTDSARDDYAMWSPDGTQIVFVSDRDGDPDIFVMDADGTNPRNLTRDKFEDYNPAWSPDGTQIAFHSDRSGDFEVWVMNADGTDLRNVSNNPANDRSAVWTNDGLRLIFDTDRDGNDEIYVMNADGTNPVNLTDNPADDQMPAWSPTGTRIAFMTNRDGNWEIYMMDDDGSEPRNLTNHDADERSPSWSMGGQYLAFVSNREGLSSIFVQSGISASPVNITLDGLSSNFSPEWQPEAYSEDTEPIAPDPG